MMDLSKLQALVTNKRADLEARSGKNGAIKPPPGKSRWRILPGWRKADRETFFHDFAQHWIKDKDGNVKGVYVCERETFQRPCEICDIFADVFRGFKSSGVTKEDHLYKAIDEMRSKRSILVNALRIDGANANGLQPLLLTLPFGLFETFLTLVTSRLVDGIQMLDLAAGRDVEITRTGSGLNTKYELVDAARETAVDPQAMDNIVNIDAWIEAERLKGVAKGTAIIGETVRTLLGSSAGAPRSSSLVLPSRAALVPAARVIEENEAPVLASTITVAAVAAEPNTTEAYTATVVPPAPAKVATPAAPVAVEPMNSGLLNDDELNALLAAL